MRTAIITAVGHDGKSVMLSGKEIPLLKQRESFMQLRKVAIMDGSHEKYREVSYQENDGSEELLTFRTPEAQKKHLEARAKEKADHAAQVKAEQQRELVPRKTQPEAKSKPEAVKK